MIRLGISALAFFGAYLLVGMLRVPDPTFVAVLGHGVGLRMGLSCIVGYMAWRRMD